MKATRSGRFTIKSVTVTEKGFTYQTFRLTGWLDGRRIRKQFKSRDEALGEQNTLQVQAANVGGTVRSRVTRLSDAQLAEAEAAFAALGGRSLTEAIAWFKANYRPPVLAMPLAKATASFLVDRAQHVRPVVMRNYRHTLTALGAAFPDRHVHDLGTADLQTFLAGREIGKKRFNNLRGELHTFFAFCQAPMRGWTRQNPATALPSFKLSRGLPEIITAQKAADLMAFVATYAGGSRSTLAPGCLVPYFALCLFAGLRPSVQNGEVAKLARSPDLAKAINAELGVIRLSPEQSKVKSVRQVTIRPNLAAWLERYPLKRFPILPPNARRMINEVRHKFGIGPDVLRHTFISMFVAKWKSLGEAALEAGNSETMIRRHYLNVVSAADAEAFWSICPTAPALGGI